MPCTWQTWPHAHQSTVRRSSRNAAGSHLAPTTQTPELAPPGQHVAAALYLSRSCHPLPQIRAPDPEAAWRDSTHDLITVHPESAKEPWSHAAPAECSIPCRTIYSTTSP